MNITVQIYTFFELVAIHIVLCHVTGECPYERDPSNPRYYYSLADHSQVQNCEIGLEFSEDNCTCVVVSQGKTSRLLGRIVHLRKICQSKILWPRFLG